MAIDSLGRLKSGGAINEDEFDTFEDLILSKKDILTADVNKTISAMEVPRQFGFSVAQQMDPRGEYRELGSSSPATTADVSSYLDKALEEVNPTLEWLQSIGLGSDNN